jgi:zinc-ribbon domain
MFCPKCAAQNIEGASFCRVCGANISLVPQALTGQLPVAQPPDDLDHRAGRRRRRNRDDGPPTLEKGIVNVFLGLGFIVAALAVMFRFPGGFVWGWSFFIPGFSCIGRGVAAIVAVRQNQAAKLPMPIGNSPLFVPAAQNSGLAAALPASGPRRTGELAPPPPSVTEGTTRHLGAEAQTRHLDSANEFQK